MKKKRSSEEPIVSIPKENGKGIAMDFIASQNDMNTSYYGGATGVLASGLVWGMAGLVGITVSNIASMVTLFIGGMLIFPFSILLSKMLKRSGKHASSNSLRHLAIESLGILFVGLFLAFVIAQTQMTFFYPIMLLAIGTRYLTFQTIYGLKTYWLLGGTLILAGTTSLFFNLQFIAGAVIGSGIEIAFSFLLFNLSKVKVAAAS